MSSSTGTQHEQSLRSVGHPLRHKYGYHTRAYASFLERHTNLVPHAVDSVGPTRMAATRAAGMAEAPRAAALLAVGRAWASKVSDEREVRTTG